MTWGRIPCVFITANMSILKYFQRTLASADDTKIGGVTTKEANKRVQAALDKFKGESGDCVCL